MYLTDDRKCRTLATSYEICPLAIYFTHAEKWATLGLMVSILKILVNLKKPNKASRSYDMNHMILFE